MKPKTENQIIGCYIKRYRLKAGMRQSELAIYVSKHHTRMLSTTHLDALERGQHAISPTRLFHIATKLGVPMEALVI